MNPSVSDRSQPSGVFSLHKAAHDPRAAALVAIAQVLAGDVESQAALDHALSSPGLVPSDKRLCTELVYGQLRWHVRLEFFMHCFLSRPDKLPGEMRLAMEQALYSMAFSRIPHRAAVHWAVEHVRNRFGQSMAKVANGALRSMQRSLNDFENLEFYRNKLGGEEGTATYFSVPAWIYRLWHKEYGEEKTRRFLEASLQGPPQGVRLNRARPGWEAALGRLREEAGNGVRRIGECMLAFEGHVPFFVKKMLEEGSASRQSAASFSIVSACNPLSWPQPLWDCCSGRGGKTMALLEANIPVALASDPSSGRLEALSEEYARLKLQSPPCPRVMNITADAENIDFSAAESKLPGSSDLVVDGRFGTVLVDAPCSGLGTLARHPEIRFRRKESACAELAAIQKRILEAVWPRIIGGGKLVYITCTVNPDENELQIADFLKRHPDSFLAGEFLPDADTPLREFFYAAVIGKNR